MSHSAPGLKPGDLVTLIGCVGTYRVVRVNGSSIELVHVATGNPAGIWPIGVTGPVRQGEPSQIGEVFHE